MKSIHEIPQELLNELFNSNIIPHIQLVQNDQYDEHYSDTEKQKIEEIASSLRAVIGIDIYRYSRYPIEKQMFIPHLFDLIYEETWHLIKQNYVFLFQEYGTLKDFIKDKFINHKEQFISTGDGGFQIFPTPIHAIIFVLTFATIVRLYNSDLFMRKMFARIGNIELRYALTWDEIYKYRNNYYGSALINNSRILAKDRLNRFLIDQNTYNWFLRSTIGIENLMTIGLSDLKEINELSGYDQSKIDQVNNALIKGNRPIVDKEGIKSIDVEKIGSIIQKGTSLEVHNLHIQAIIHYRSFFDQEKLITVSVGNLNTAGIGDE